MKTDPIGSNLLGHLMRARNKGFTLIELIIAIALLAIMLALAGPSFIITIKDSRLVSSSNAMISNLLLARSEAVKQMVQVVVCPSADSSSCSGNWSDSKRIVFIDHDNDGVRDAPGDELLRIEDEVVAFGQAWSAVATATGAATTKVLFRANGPSDQAHTLTLTDSRGETKCIQVRISGRSGPC